MVRSLLQPGSCETSLVVQWLRPPVVHTSSAGGLGLIPGLGTKIPHATQVVKKKKKANKQTKTGSCGKSFGCMLKLTEELPPPSNPGGEC